MAGFRVWVETKESGNHVVRHAFPNGERGTDYIVGESDRGEIDGKVYVGKNLANRLREVVLKKYWSRELGNFDLSLKIQPLFEQFIDERIVDNLSPCTINHNLASIRAYIEDTGCVTLNDIVFDGAEKIKAWKKAMLYTQNLAYPTVCGRLGDVRTFLNWLVENKRIGQSPFGKKMMPEKKEPSPKFYTPAEFAALDKALSEINHPTRLLCRLAHFCGLRKGEALGSRMEDLIWSERGAMILVRKENAKGKKRSRSIPIDPETIELLGSRRPGPIIEATRHQVDHFFQTARKRAGINCELDIHGLRHTYAKNYLQAGGDMGSLRINMGHSSYASTQIYAQFEQRYINEAHDRMYEKNLRDITIGGQNTVKGISEGNLRVTDPVSNKQRGISRNIVKQSNDA